MWTGGESCLAYAAKSGTAYSSARSASTFARVSSASAIAFAVLSSRVNCGSGGRKGGSWIMQCCTGLSNRGFVCSSTFKGGSSHRSGLPFTSMSPLLSRARAPNYRSQNWWQRQMYGQNLSPAAARHAMNVVGDDSVERCGAPMTSTDCAAVHDVVIYRLTNYVNVSSREPARTHPHRPCSIADSNGHCFRSTSSLVLYSA